MKVWEALVAFLLADPVVSGIVGKSIYPQVGTDIPGDYPRLTWELVSRQEDSTLLLASDQPVAHIAFHAWAQGQHGERDADALSVAVRTATGPNAAGSRLFELCNVWLPQNVPSPKPAGNSVWVKHCWLDDEATAEAQKAVGGGKKWIFQQVQVFLISWNVNLYA